MLFNLILKVRCTDEETGLLTATHLTVWDGARDGARDGEGFPLESRGG